MSEVEEVVGTGPPLKVIFGLLGGLFLVGVIIIAVMSSSSEAPPPPPKQQADASTAPAVQTVVTTVSSSASPATPGVILSSASGLPNTVVVSGDIYKAIAYTLAKQRTYTTMLGGKLEFTGLSPAAATADALPTTGKIFISGFATKPGSTMQAPFAGQYYWSGSSDKKSLVIMDLNRTRTFGTITLVGGRFNLISTTPAFSTLLTPA